MKKDFSALYQYDPQFATQIAIYSMICYGMGFTALTPLKVVPLSLKYSIPGIREALDTNIKNIENSPELLENISNQWIQNNPQFAESKKGKLREVNTEKLPKSTNLDTSANYKSVSFPASYSIKGKYVNIINNDEFSEYNAGTFKVVSSELFEYHGTPFIRYILQELPTTGSYGQFQEYDYDVPYIAVPINQSDKYQSVISTLDVNPNSTNMPEMELPTPEDPGEYVSPFYDEEETKLNSNSSSESVDKSNDATDKSGINVCK